MSPLGLENEGFNLLIALIKSCLFRIWLGERERGNLGEMDLLGFEYPYPRKEC